jgi:hypothetical protein
VQCKISSSGFTCFRNSCIFLFSRFLHSQRGYVWNLVTKREIYPSFISIPSTSSCTPQFISWSGKTPSTFLMSVFFLFYHFSAGLGTNYVQRVWKVAVHLQKLLEVMSTSVYTGPNSFNLVSKHFLQICVLKVAVHL